MNEVDAMYIHIPFCKNICSYCDFTKIFYNQKYEEKYLMALFKEIQDENPKKCKTIYVGGGTPTSLTINGLKKLLSYLNVFLKDDYEFTIEVNPETIDEEKVRLFKEYGINRVSIGVESFDKSILNLLGRKHSYSEVRKCVELLNKYEIRNYSFDFIYGINGLTIKHIENDFKYIDELNPKHLSFYSLILENNTCLKAKKYKELDEEEVVEQYEYIYRELKNRGYEQYEVSNYSKKGYRSIHNLVYWKNKRYYGFGLGACGYIDNQRYSNTKNITKYLNGTLDRIYEKLTINDKKEEFIMLGLRLNEGISLSEYKRNYGEDLLITKSEPIRSLIEKKLIKISGDRLYATHQGMLLLDVVIISLI